jgi:hypothetical protein
VFAAPLSVVFPFHNASDRLEAAVSSLLSVLHSTLADFELILVDDGSSDTSGRIADQLAAQYRPVMIIHHRHRWGYGPSLHDGWLAARGKYLLALDLESLSSLADLPSLLPHTASYPLVLGYRYHHTPSPRPESRLMRVLTGVELHDPTYRFALLRSDKLDQCLTRDSGEWVLAELAVHLNRQGQSFLQVPLRHYRESSNLHPAARMLAPYQIAATLRQHDKSSDPYRLRNTTARTALGVSLGLMACAGGFWLARRSLRK